MSLMLDDSVGFAEPGDEPAEVTAAKDRNVLAISDDMDRVKSSLNEFDRVSAGLAELEARFPKDAVYPVQTTKGMKDAVEHRAAWREPRILVEKARKMAKAPLLALGKSIDARAAWLTTKLEEGEKPVDQQIKVEEARREEERAARAAAEAGRILAIQEALAEIGQRVLIACGKTSKEVRELSEQMHATQPDQDVFQEMLPQAREAWLAAITKLETALKAKLWEEAEQKRIADERAAEEALRQQEAERIAAQRIENERIAAEQKKRDEEFAAKQAAFEEQQAELQRQQAELQRRERQRVDQIEARFDRLKAWPETLRTQEASSAQIRAKAQQIADREITEDDFGEWVARAITVKGDVLKALEVLALEADTAEAARAAAALNTQAQDPQQVLKAEPATAEATDRGVPVIESPDGGPMGAGQATAAGLAEEVAAPPPAPVAGSVRYVSSAPAAPAEQPTLKLGVMCERLGFTVSAAFLESLGFPPAATDKRACLYRESDWKAICQGISAHTLAVGAGKLMEAA